jgi:hypothetical protein
VRTPKSAIFAEMLGEREQRCAHYEGQVHPNPHAKHAALQIAAHSHDDGVDHEAMNDDRAQGRCESYDQGTKYSNLTRHLSRQLMSCSALALASRSARVPLTAHGQAAFVKPDRAPNWLKTINPDFVRT